MEKAICQSFPASEDASSANTSCNTTCINKTMGTFSDHQSQSSVVFGEDQTLPVGAVARPEEDKDITANSSVQSLPNGILEASITSGDSQAFNYEVDFEGNDPENPKNWPLSKRGFVLLVISYTTWVVIFYSSAYTAGIAGMLDDFGINSKTLGTLGLTSYMLGMAVGFSIWAPLSEVYGRRMVYMISYGLFFILVLPCALSRSLTGIVVARFFG